MDLTIRDWMVVVGVLLIAAVLVDAWRRVRSERRERVRLKIARTDDDSDLEPLEHPTVQRELPNGGARILRREDLARAREQSEGAGPLAAEEDSQARAARPPLASMRREPPGKAPGGMQREPAVAHEAGDDDLVSGLRGDRSEPANIDWLDDLLPEAADDESEGEGRLPRDPDPEVYMLHVVANNPEGFKGEDIMHILLACDLRFGDMDFFHRHEQSAGRGPIQFSVANMMQPGVFDIDNMSQLKTQGLLFFVTLPGPEDMMKAFDYMLETAQAVARNLGGSVLDETRSVVTPQTLEHSRQQIRELERRMLARGR